MGDNTYLTEKCLHEVINYVYMMVGATKAVAVV